MLKLEQVWQLAKMILSSSASVFCTDLNLKCQGLWSLLCVMFFMVSHENNKSIQIN